MATRDNLTTRGKKGSKLTHAELDNNFYLTADTLDENTASLQQGISNAMNMTMAVATTANDALVQAQNVSGFKNKIINGKMDVAQRGTSFAAAASGTYPADRFVFSKIGTFVVDLERLADGPSNAFPNNIKVTVKTPITTLQAGDACSINQIIEGYTINSIIDEDIVLSFYVKSSQPGTYCVSFRNSTISFSLIAEYTINSANVYEFKEILIPRGLASGLPWDTGNTTGLRLGWTLASGSNYRNGSNLGWTSNNSLATENQINFLATAYNTFSLTGVQLERSSVATAYEHRPHPIELMLCQRYYEQLTAVHTTGTTFSQSYWKVSKRSTPTVTIAQVSGSNPPTFVPGWLGVDMVYQSSSTESSGTVIVRGDAEL